MSAMTVSHDDIDSLTTSAAWILTGELRAALKNAAQWASMAADLIDQAWAMRADITLGYASWEAYCADQFEVVRSYRMPVPQRQELVAALTEIGMSTRKVAAPLGISEGQVRLDLKAARTPLAVTQPAPALTKVAQTLAALAAAGERGLTAPEAGRKVKDAPDPGAILSELHARGRVARLAATDPAGTRGGHAVYVALEHVAGREVEAPGRRSRRA